MSSRDVSYKYDKAGMLYTIHSNSGKNVCVVLIESYLLNAFVEIVHLLCVRRNKNLSSVYGEINDL